MMKHDIAGRWLRGITVVCLLALTACAGDEPKGPVLATKEQLWHASGTKDAIFDLDQSLSEACRATINTPDDLLKLPPAEANCVRTKLVAAFDADAGAEPCAQGRDLKQFAGCILEGQFIGQVMTNSGAEALPPALQWGDADEAGRQANKILSEKIKGTCVSPSDAQRKACAEAERLRYFGIDAQAIDFCPNLEQRDACIYWAAFAKSLRAKADRIGA